MYKYHIFTCFVVGLPLNISVFKIFRLSQEERCKRFGIEGTDSYKEELKKHQEWAISNLVSITKVFISSIHDNLHCFPSSIWWLIGQIFARLNSNNNVPEKEVCTFKSNI